MSEEATGATTPRAGRTDERQAALLAAFEKLLGDGASLHSLTIEAIAQEAGMSRSAFYFYFESKHDLLRAAVREVLRDMMFAASTFFDGTLGDPAEELRVGIENVAAAWRNHDMVMRALIEGSGSDPALQHFLQEFVESFVHPVVARVTEVSATGDLDSLERVTNLARSLLWMNERNFYYATVQRLDDRQWDALAETLVTVWRRALLRSDD